MPGARWLAAGWRVVYVAVLAFSVQLLLLGAIVSMETIGLTKAGRTALELHADFYEPGARLALRTVIPGSWQTFGNVLAGFFAIFLAMAFYAVVFAIGWTMFEAFLARRRRTRRAQAVAEAPPIR